MTTPAPVPPTITVLRQSSAFQAAWSAIAEELGLPVVETESHEQLVGMGAASIRLIACGGVERTAVATLRSGKLGGAPIAVIGADRDHRIAVGLLSAGATEYFALPHDFELLRGWIREQTRHPVLVDWVDPGLREAGEDSPIEVIPFPATMREITRRAASAMVERCGGNKSEAARRLAISRTRLLRLLTVDHDGEVRGR